jgi:aryl-alcohol dehydrogenase-like predicted oxidoreductase
MQPARSGLLCSLTPPYTARNAVWDAAVDATAGVLAEFEGCLERLDMDHVDLLLLHWPGPPPNGLPSIAMIVRCGHFYAPLFFVCMRNR